MTRDEELLNEIIQRRGYLVVSVRGKSFAVGEMLDEQPVYCDTGRRANTETRWYVVAITDEADARGQQQLVRRLEPWRALERQFFDAQFYRVLSD